MRNQDRTIPVIRTNAPDTRTIPHRFLSLPSISTPLFTEQVELSKGILNEALSSGIKCNFKIEEGSSRNSRLSSYTIYER